MAPIPHYLLCSWVLPAPEHRAELTAQGDTLLQDLGVEEGLPSLSSSVHSCRSCGLGGPGTAWAELWGSFGSVGRDWLHHPFGRAHGWDKHSCSTDHASAVLGVKSSSPVTGYQRFLVGIFFLCTFGWGQGPHWWERVESVWTVGKGTSSYFISWLCVTP